MQAIKGQPGGSFVDANTMFKKYHAPKKNGKNIYAKQRETDTIKRAQDIGYFLNITKCYIEQQFAPEIEMDLNEDDGDCPLIIKYLKKKVKRRDISRVYLVNLPRMHLRSLGDLGACRNLTVCILAENFINRFDALINCPNLTKIDLHGNQIVIIPGQDFWRFLVFLRILHLHDNPIGSISNLQNLAASQTLVALTAYDTPVCLRQNYRHHLVNSIWTLKALDHHVVSDEELIEDAYFRGHFTSLSQPFKINLCSSTREETTFEEEIKTVRDILRSIEHTLTHNSPVLIIQRFIRGYLVRRKFYRFHLKYPSSPVQESPRDEENDKAANRDLEVAVQQDEKAEVVAFRDAVEKEALGPRLQGQKHVFIDISKLQKTLDTLHSEIASSGTLEQIQEEGESKLIATKYTENKPRKVRQCWQKEDLAAEGEESDQFSLKGVKKEPIYCDPTYTMLMERKELGSEVRFTMAKYHRQAEAAHAPKVITKDTQVTNEERFFQKTQATMGFGCLRAVQQAYKQRDDAEKKAAKLEHVQVMRQQRENGQFRIKLFKQEQRSSVMKARVLDRYDIMNNLKHQEMRRHKELELLKQKNLMWEELWRYKIDELSFIRDLSGSLMSIAKSQFAAKSTVDKLEKEIKGSDGTSDKTKLSKESKQSKTDRELNVPKVQLGTKDEKEKAKVEKVKVEQEVKTPNTDERTTTAQMKKSKDQKEAKVKILNKEKEKKLPKKPKQVVQNPEKRIKLPYIDGDAETESSSQRTGSQCISLTLI